MEILIIGNDNTELVEKILELVSDTDTTVQVSKSFDQLDWSVQLSLLDVSLRSEFIKGKEPFEFASDKWNKKYGYPCDENPDLNIGHHLIPTSDKRGLGLIDRIVGIKGSGKNNIILVGNRKTEWADFLQSNKNRDSTTPTLVELSEGFNENILRTIEPIKAAEEPNPFHFSGYEHTFGKILHIKRQLDFDNTKCLSVVNCNQNKSLLKQHNIKQQPIICRKHGVDNRK